MNADLNIELLRRRRYELRIKIAFVVIYVALIVWCVYLLKVNS